MFKKIVTELAYSPALGGELTAYIRRLRHEKNKRQIGLIFIALVLVVQLFTTLQPPESANANNPMAFIEGGIQSTDEFLRVFDQNASGIKDLLTSLGITRADIQASRSGTVSSTDRLVIWTLSGDADSSSMPYTFSSGNKGMRVAHYRPLDAKDSPAHPSHGETNLPAYVGSSSLGRFALLRSNGNLITQDITDIICSSDTGSSSPEYASNIFCSETLNRTLSARNITADLPAASRAADASDRIIFTLSARNTGTSDLPVSLSIGVKDMLDYAYLLDKGGSTFDETTKMLIWPEATLAPNESLTRSFIIKLQPVIPSTARGVYNTDSYDCKINTSYGDTLTIPVACPFPKTIEQTVNRLPHTPAAIGLTFTLTVAFIALYFYVRSRQLLAELHRIQHNHSGSI